jgi:hypothetical protein
VLGGPDLFRGRCGGQREGSGVWGVGCMQSYDRGRLAMCDLPTRMCLPASQKPALLRALQHLSRFKNSFSGLLDKSIHALDASAHLEDLNEAVAQHVVDVVGLTLNGRAAHIFGAPSVTHGRLAFHDANPKPARSYIEADLRPT